MPWYRCRHQFKVINPLVCFSHETTTRGFFLRFIFVVKSNGCWLWDGNSFAEGYGYVWFKELKRVMGAHRAAWIIYNGKIPAGLFVCHTCDNRACVNPKHLFLGTQKENVGDCIKKGRFFYVEKRKLTAEQISQIRTLYRYGNGRLLAKRYGVSRTTISDIVNKKPGTTYENL